MSSNPIDLKKKEKYQLISAIDEINLFQYLHKEKRVYTYERRKIYSVRKKKKERRGTMVRGRNSGFEMPTRLSSWDRPLSLVCVCILSAETHAALRTAAQSERYKETEREKNISISIFFFFCVFIYLEMIVPGTAGGQGPLGSPGGRRLVSVCCAVWGPL